MTDHEIRFNKLLSILNRLLPYIDLEAHRKIIISDELRELKYPEKPAKPKPKFETGEIINFYTDDLDLNEWKYTGMITCIFPEGFVTVRFKDSRGKDRTRQVHIKQCRKLKRKKK
jgi:hypothetical protein